jgi:hypothetical protein
LLEHPIIPMVGADEITKLEGVAGPGGVDHPAPVCVVDVKSALRFTPANLEGLLAPHEVVIAGIERKQHPNPPVGVRVQQEDVPILRRPELDLGVVAPDVLAVITQPDLDGRVGRRHGGSQGTGREGNQDRGEHMTSRRAGAAVVVTGYLPPGSARVVP